MRKQYLIFLFSTITYVNLFISCSSVPKSTFQNSYYSPDYENKTFENVSMDICIRDAKYEYNAGLDSNIVSSHLNFVSTFRKYFLDGIKMFSTVTKTGWIFYDVNWENFPIVYDSTSDNGRYHYSVSMPDSLSYFQHNSDADFIFIVHHVNFMGQIPENSKADLKNTEDYSSNIQIDYSIWNNKNSRLVVKDQILVSSKFKTLVNEWPFRNVLIKTAAEIFNKLPMFSK